MPKTSYLKDQSGERVKRLIEVIYGTGVNRRQYSLLARATGIPRETVSAWCREDPSRMPIGKAMVLLEAIGATADDWMYVFTGRREARSA